MIRILQIGIIALSVYCVFASAYVFAADCPDGQVWNTIDEQCEIVNDDGTTTATQDCPVGDVYNLGTQSCEPQSVDCPSGQLFNTGTQQCENVGSGQPTSGTPGGSGSSVGGSGSSVGGSGSSVTNTGFTKLINPLKFATLEAFLLAVIDVLLTFALPVIIFFIMYAGYLFVTAAGNEGQISTAKSALLWAIIGGVVILGAKLIITVIQGTVTAFGV